MSSRIAFALILTAIGVASTREGSMQAFCGIDWAEDHHDVAIIDTTGHLLSGARIGNDPEGLHRLLELLTDAGDTPEQPIPVAIETTRGLLVACLRTTRPVYAFPRWSTSPTPECPY